MKTLNDRLQWAGTTFVLTMYVLMNFFPELHPWNIVMGLLGALCFFAWAYRVVNKPQMLINIVAVMFCISGLIKYYLIHQ